MREIKIKEEWDKKKVGGNVQSRIKERKEWDSCEIYTHMYLNRSFHEITKIEQNRSEWDSCEI